MRIPSGIAVRELSLELVHPTAGRTCFAFLGFSPKKKNGDRHFFWRRELSDIQINLNVAARPIHRSARRVSTHRVTTPARRAIDGHDAVGVDAGRSYRGGSAPPTCTKDKDHRRRDHECASRVPPSGPAARGGDGDRGAPGPADRGRAPPGVSSRVSHRPRSPRRPVPDPPRATPHENHPNPLRRKTLA